MCGKEMVWWGVWHRTNSYIIKSMNFFDSICTTLQSYILVWSLNGIPYLDKHVSVIFVLSLYSRTPMSRLCGWEAVSKLFSNSFSSHYHSVLAIYYPQYIFLKCDCSFASEKSVNREIFQVMDYWCINWNNVYYSERAYPVLRL